MIEWITNVGEFAICSKWFGVIYWESVRGPLQQAGDCQFEVDSHLVFTRLLETSANLVLEFCITSEEKLTRVQLFLIATIETQ